MDRRAQQATVHGVAKSQMLLSYSMHTQSSHGCIGQPCFIPLKNRQGCSIFPGSYRVPNVVHVSSSRKNTLGTLFHSLGPHSYNLCSWRTVVSCLFCHIKCWSLTKGNQLSNKNGMASWGLRCSANHGLCKLQIRSNLSAQRGRRGPIFPLGLIF